MSRALNTCTASDSGESVIRAGWLLDGQGGAPLVDQWITLAHGDIASVVPALEVLRVPDKILNFSHATILPALMDAHVHLALSGTLETQRRHAQLAATPQQTKDIIGQHVASHRQCGVVAVRDAGDRSGAVLQVKQQGTLIHVAATCWAWHCAGRYGGMIGRSFDPSTMSNDDFRMPLKGADHIKLIQSGLNSLDCFGLQSAPQFSTDQLAMMSRMAHPLGLPLMVHANGPVPVAMAIAAGARSIEHGYFMGRENLRRLAQQPIFWVPTAIPMAMLTRPHGVGATQAAVARKTLDHQLSQIAFGHQQGVAIALGTDAGALGVDHGRAVVQELSLLVTAGLSVPQAVRCASLNVAALMGLEKQGALRPGWRADLIAVPGPPEALPESLNHIEAVCIQGQWL
jgi:imidazolonepropionase-like amidohydrolase